MVTDRRTYKLVHDDAHPELPIERGVKDRGVGWWVPGVKHKLLADFVETSSGARRKYPHRIFVDLFCGPGRVQVEGETETRDGGSLVAWRQAARVVGAEFTQVIVGDLDPKRVKACEARLLAVGAPVQALEGSATETAAAALKLIPADGSLVLAYLDPYNLEHLSFEIIRTLANLPRVDFAVHFSTMDLSRNVELEFERMRFDDFAPGWRDVIDPIRSAKRGLREALFEYWCDQVKALGFTFSQRMPLIKAEGNKPLYRLVFFSRHGLPNRMWSDVAQGDTRDLF